MESIPAGATDDSLTYQAGVGSIAEKLDPVTTNDRDRLVRRTTEGCVFKIK